MGEGISPIRLVSWVSLVGFIFGLLHFKQAYLLEIILLGAAHDEYTVIVSRADWPGRFCSFLNDMVFMWAASQGLPVLNLVLIVSQFLLMIRGIIRAETTCGTISKETGKKTVSLSYFHQLVTEMFGLMYISFFYSHSYLLWIEAKEDGFKWISYTIICAGAGDVGALAIGKLIGKTKFVPKVSPNKTLEGLISCLVTSMLVSGPVAWTCGFQWTKTEVAILGFLMGVSCVVGDLFESVLKRSYNIKDTGWLLPGMGGVLDRLDSFLVAFPINYYAYYFYFRKSPIL